MVLVGKDFPKRILIYGVCGSGKSTLASRLSAKHGIPWTSVDDLAFGDYWEPVHWTVVSKSIQEVCDQDAWILDTAYAKWIEVPLARVELIVALDYSRWFTLQRLLRRTFTRLRDKTPVCNGNVESLKLFLSRDSILLWHFKSFSRKRARMRSWATREGGPIVLSFKTHRQLERWLQALPS